MSDDAGTEQKAHRGERLAQAIYWVRRGGVTSQADCELLVEEIDRLRAENGQLRCELQKRDDELLDAARYQAPHDCEQWMADARCCRQCSAEFSRASDRLAKENVRLREENARLREAAARYVEREMRAWDGDEICRERDKWRREADMARAARNVALDKLVQIARIVSPNDFECEDVPRDPVARAVWMRAQADALLAHMDPAVWPEEEDA